MRPRLSVVPLVVCAAVFVGGSTWWARYHYDPTAGPIDSSQNGLAYAQPLEVGQPFSIGITSLFNSGKTPVVVERVRLLGVTGPLGSSASGRDSSPTGTSGRSRATSDSHPSGIPTRSRDRDLPGRRSALPGRPAQVP